MNPEPQTPPLFAREQFRMTRLQVYNWGTFSGLHDVPISERGFLFVGRSGAGKSTLLDAFSALLTPPRWIDFNAAARGRTAVVVTGTSSPTYVVRGLNRRMGSRERSRPATCARGRPGQPWR